MVSSDSAPDSGDNPFLNPDVLRRYQEGPERFCADHLDLRLARTQRRILESIVSNQRTLVVSGNGVGKSYAVAAGIVWWVLTRPDSVALLTSGSYSQMEDTTWRPMKSLLGVAEKSWPIAQAARALDSRPPRIETHEDEWYFKGVSPTNPDGLEGRHNQECLVVIEEADKPEIEAEHFDSAGSSITDTHDRFVAVANPPTDESNIVADLMDSPRWDVIQFDSFDSHNVQLEAPGGDIEGDDTDPIPGLVTLDLLKEDWSDWNNREWPGWQEARHSRDESLSSRWYRRRLGEMPPGGASAWRPVDTGTVSRAFERSKSAAGVTYTRVPDTVAIDVARKVDNTVMYGLHGDVLEVHYSQQGTDHTDQESALRDIIDQWRGGDIPIAIDHTGSGEGLGDRLNQAYPQVHHFQNGGIAAAETTYYDCWTEGLDLLGDFLASGGVISDTHLREELLAASRAITLSERHLSSRGQDGADVIDSDSKDDIKDVIDRSPDYLDAALMAVWMREAEPDTSDTFLISY